MSKFVTLHGFGGGEEKDLNFEVVGGTTNPINPTENMIWINTDVVDIPAYYFQVEQPENMSDGDVWFISDSYGAGVTAFNLSKNNTVMVYPFEVNQMINGTLVVKQAKIWQNNEWVDFTPVSLYLYNSGDNCIDITGGWESKALPNAALSVSDITGGVKIIQYTSGGTGVYKTKNKVSLKGYNSLFFTGTINRPNAYTGNPMGIRIYSDMGSNVSANVVAEYIPPVKENNIFDDVLMIDISTLNESYYIAFFITSDNNKYFNINKLRISR